MKQLLAQILIFIGVHTMAPTPPHTPEGGDVLIAQMVELYEAAADDINRLAGRAISELDANPDRRASQFRQIRAAQMSRAIEQKLEQLSIRSEQLLQSPLKDTIEDAIRRGDEELSKVGLDRSLAPAGAEVGFALIAGEAVEVLAQDTIIKAKEQIGNDLRSSIEQHANGAIELLRSLSESTATSGGQAAAEARVNKAIGRGLITGNPIIADRAIRELYAADSAEAQRVRKLGNKRIQVGKATMTVRQYAATVTRTRTREATVQARHNRLLEKGVNLVQITGRNSENFCTAFIGLVCSIGPAPQIEGLEVISLASLPGGGPPFHPNCSKGTAPYIHELVSKGRQASAHRALNVYKQRAATGGLLNPVKR